MRRPFRYWRQNRRFSGFSWGQLLAIYGMGFALRRGISYDQMRPALNKAFRHRSAWERQVMLEAAWAAQGKYPFVLNRTNA
jgi:hypothetical protein